MNIIGNSKAIRKSFELSEQCANFPFPVLLTGETGTGKDVFAKHIHKKSGLKNFVVVNCAAITENLFESEFFGHEKGAFTGAISQKIGLVEQANMGTLFLDEVGELSMNNQAKLLRTLQDRSFRMVGSTFERTSDFRLICATNKDLFEMIEEGTFREDLYYRISSIDIEIPPLRERGHDSVLIARDFVVAKSNLKLTPKAEAAIKDYNWPGNVRELNNIIEYSIVVSKHEITDNEVSARFSDEVDGKCIQSVEKNAIMAALSKNNFNRGKAAFSLGVHPSTLYRKIKRFDLDELVA